MVVLWPLSRAVPLAVDADIAFFHTQTARIAADLQRELLGPDEAEETRLMAARLLLQTKSPDNQDEYSAASGLIRRKWISLGSLFIIPAVAFGIYAKLGADLPSTGLASGADAADPMIAAVAKIEGHLAAFPKDGMGYEVLVPAYERLGRYEDAVNAARKSNELLGETAERQAMLAEALIYAADGKVGDQARKALDRALQLKPDLPIAVYYQAAAAEQDGHPEQARSMLAALLRQATPNAPWRASVETYFNKLSQTTGDASPGQLPADSMPMIKDMVDGLAAKLQQDPDNIEGWLRLIRSYSVLHQTEDAKKSLLTARTQFAARPQELQRLKDLAVEQGLGD
eukprot:gene13998-14116_t